jgi:hypothetical protein
MGIGDVFTHSTTWIEFVGLLFPSAGRTVESAMYPGGLVLLMIILAVGMKKIRKQATFWWLTAGISALYALGSNLPGLKYMAYIPGFNLLRVPSRSLFILGLSFSVIACYLLQEMMDAEYTLGRVSFAITAVGFFSVLLLVGMGTLGDSFPITLFWGMGSITLGMILLNLRNRLGLMKWWLPLLFLLLLVDGIGSGFLNIDFRPGDEGKENVADLLAGDRESYGHFRSYSPSYSIPQHIAARGYLEMADGVDPLQIEAYVDFMEDATGVSNPGYSVTLPPFKGDPSQVNQGYEPNLELLGLLNVRYIVSAFEIPVKRLTLIKREDGLYIYQNPDAFPRAWVQANSDPAACNEMEVGYVEWEEAQVEEWRPNKIVVSAKGPGRMVLSEIAYPGWEVKVDDQRGRWSTVYCVLRGVEIPHGDHRIEFMYRPKSIYLGLILFLIGAAVVIRDIYVDKSIT